MAVLGQALAPAQTTGLELRVESVTLQFEGLKALDDVSFTVPPGQLAALIGPNGAGKSSMVNCCTGLYRATQGTVAIGGNDVTRMRAHKVARLGVSRTFQNLALFKGMTVLENLMVGRYLYGKTGIFRGMFYLPGSVREEEAQRERVEEIIDSSTSRAIATPTCPTCPTGSRSGSSSGGRSSRTRSSCSSTSR